MMNKESLSSPCCDSLSKMYAQSEFRPYGITIYEAFLGSARKCSRMAENVSDMSQSPSEGEWKAWLEKRDSLIALIAKDRENNNLANQQSLFEVTEQIRKVCRHEEVNETDHCVQCKAKPSFSGKFENNAIRHNYDNLLSLVNHYKSEAEKHKPLDITRDEWEELKMEAEELRCQKKKTKEQATKLSKVEKRLQMFCTHLTRTNNDAKCPICAKIMNYDLLRKEELREYELNKPSRLVRLGQSLLMFAGSVAMFPVMITWSVGLGLMHIGAFFISKWRKSPVINMTRDPSPQDVLTYTVAAILAPFANLLNIGHILLFLD